MAAFGLSKNFLLLCMCLSSFQLQRTNADDIKARYPLELPQWVNVWGVDELWYKMIWDMRSKLPFRDLRLDWATSGVTAFTIRRRHLWLLWPPDSKLRNTSVSLQHFYRKWAKGLLGLVPSNDPDTPMEACASKLQRPMIAETTDSTAIQIPIGWRYYIYSFQLGVVGYIHYHSPAHIAYPVSILKDQIEAVASFKNTGKQTNILKELQTNLVQQLAILYEAFQTVGPNKNPTKYESFAAAEFHFLHTAAQSIPQLYASTLKEIEACKEACNVLNKRI
jgi:hypothetical protein